MFLQCSADTVVRSVRFIWSETSVLPQGSSGTGQFQDWTGGYAAGLSKQDVYPREHLLKSSSSVALNFKLHTSRHNFFCFLPRTA